MPILAPGLEHTVAAEQEGEMLVTVHLTAATEPEAPPENKRLSSRKTDRSLLMSGDVHGGYDLVREADID
jgi:hypothetical protein